ncbi:MAG: hypothetical protein ABIP71_03365 [Verrucomicrobiota bacterium]
MSGELLIKIPPVRKCETSQTSPKLFNQTVAQPNSNLLTRGNVQAAQSSHWDNSAIAQNNWSNIKRGFNDSDAENADLAKQMVDEGSSTNGFLQSDK